MLLSQFSLVFRQTQNRMPHADRDGICDHLRDVPWEDIFELSASAAALWVQVGIDVYISHKYQVIPHSSPWFSAAFAAAIVHRNSFFHCYLYQQNKSESKLHFRQASNGCKRVLAYATRTKDQSLPRNFAVRTFDKLLIVSTKVSLLYLLYSTVQRCCLLHLVKQNSQDS